MIKLPLVIDNTDASSFRVDGELKHRVCVFRGNSGSGKSLLFRKLLAIFDDLNYTSSLVRLSDVLNPSVGLLDVLNLNVDILLIDNGDLVPLRALVSALDKCPAKLILITSRDFADRSDVGYYVVKYTGSELEFKIGWC